MKLLPPSSDRREENSPRYNPVDGDFHRSLPNYKAQHPTGYK